MYELLYRTQCNTISTSWKGEEKGQAQFIGDLIGKAGKGEMGYPNAPFCTSENVVGKTRRVSWNVFWEVKWSLWNAQSSYKQKSELDALLNTSFGGCLWGAFRFLEYSVTAYFAWLHPEKPVKLFSIACGWCTQRCSVPFHVLWQGKAFSLPHHRWLHGQSWQVGIWQQWQKQEISRILRPFLPINNMLQINTRKPNKAVIKKGIIVVHTKRNFTDEEREGSANIKYKMSFSAHAFCRNFLPEK